MATTEEVKKLAALARISMPEAELVKFTKEFDSILAYVGQLGQLELPKAKTAGGGSPDAAGAAFRDTRPLRNIFRDDANPTPPGTWTTKMVDAFPEKEDDYLVVKQIISHE